MPSTLKWPIHPYNIVVEYSDSYFILQTSMLVLLCEITSVDGIRRVLDLPDFAVCAVNGNGEDFCVRVVQLRSPDYSSTFACRVSNTIERSSELSCLLPIFAERRAAILSTHCHKDLPDAFLEQMPKREAKMIEFFG